MFLIRSKINPYIQNHSTTKNKMCKNCYQKKAKILSLSFIINEIFVDDEMDTPKTASMRQTGI